VIQPGLKEKIKNPRFHKTERAVRQLEKKIFAKKIE